MNSICLWTGRREGRGLASGSCICQRSIIKWRTCSRCEANLSQGEMQFEKTRAKVQGAVTIGSIWKPGNGWLGIMHSLCVLPAEPLLDTKSKFSSCLLSVLPIQQKRIGNTHSDEPDRFLNYRSWTEAIVEVTLVEELSTWVHKRKQQKTKSESFMPWKLYNEAVSNVCSSIFCHSKSNTLWFFVKKILLLKKVSKKSLVGMRFKHNLPKSDIDLSSKWNSGQW